MELGQLRSLLALLRDNGVTSYRNGDLELTLGTVGGNESSPEEVDTKQSKREKFLREAGIPEQYHRAIEVIGE